jgi:ATP-dependent DNA helicase RecG
MLADSGEESRDYKILPGTSLDDLHPPSIEGYRASLRATKPGHVFLENSDSELLRSLGGWRRDRESGEEGLTTAGNLDVW